MTDWFWSVKYILTLISNPHPKANSYHLFSGISLWPTNWSGNRWAAPTRFAASATRPSSCHIQLEPGCFKRAAVLIGAKLVEKSYFLWARARGEESVHSFFAGRCAGKFMSVMRSMTLTSLLLVYASVAYPAGRVHGRALIFGGGVSVGEAWESGVIAGLAEKGVALSAPAA
jgi:hypothetical protein